MGFLAIAIALLQFTQDLRKDSVCRVPHRAPKPIYILNALIDARKSYYFHLNSIFSEFSRVIYEEKVKFMADDSYSRHGDMGTWGHGGHWESE
ncbi:MAG: hypothetical protein F6J93_17680 [Oscillatoria sp. SIO1A7]|nr:hypothetical protein [Oscillatoria sp. SIO1A7]